MRSIYSVITLVLLALFHPVVTIPAAAYSLLLPAAAPSPGLPYTAEQDHYGGPACVQMALNSCPNAASRHLNSQADIYTSILSHNTEPTTWFSDPNGIKGALSDPIFSPCGHWSDYSNTDKSSALGKMVYYMDTMKYLMPVSIGSSEHWVTVIGYQTDAKPTYSGSVTLQSILFYDPLPGNVSAMWVSGTVWLNDSTYWGTPLNKPGSAWHNKYIAIIEPPKTKLTIKVRPWLLEGIILPGERIELAVTDWLKLVQEQKLTRGPFKNLSQATKFEKPILVKAEKYSYYIVPFKDSRMSAIFNAYDGSFEEFRYTQKVRRFVFDQKAVNDGIKLNLREFDVDVIRIDEPKLLYKPALSTTGRFAPVWEAQVTIKDARGKERQLPVFMDTEGQVLKRVRTFKQDLDLLPMKKGVVQ